MLGLLIERLILSRMVGQPVFAVIMITIGLSIVIEQVDHHGAGAAAPSRSTTRGASRRSTLGEVTVAESDLARIVVAAVLLAAFFLFFRFSVLGVAMRATASTRRRRWPRASASAASSASRGPSPPPSPRPAGVLLASGGRGVEPSLGIIALVAFPAIILGGLDSPGGAVVGGVIIGIVEMMTAGYSDKLPEFLGANFQRVTPYVVLVLILLIRPYGLFGTKEVQRV